MSFSKAPLWQQLSVVWSVALLLAAAILWFETRQPYKFFWLIPYPAWRTLWPAVVEFFQTRPLLAFALVGIPVVTILATLALCVVRLAPLLRMGRVG